MASACSNEVQGQRVISLLCPRFCLNVRLPVSTSRAGLLEDVDALGNGETRAEAVKCLACSGVHLVNPKTGKILGLDEN